MEPVFFAKEFENKNFSNHIVFICDHASNYIPRKYRKLGISDSDLQSHIAFDIGAKNLTINLAKKLKQSYFLSNFSRLLIDPNRKEMDRELIIVRSFGVEIPKNLNISDMSNKYEIPKNLLQLIENKQNAYLALKIVEIIGEDEPYQLDSETIYFITNLLNKINLIKIRNKVLVSALPQRV